MMKKRGKYIVAAVLFVAVFAIGALFQNFTSIMQGRNALFLLTGDYFREAFAGRWPLSNILASFFIQFYDIPMVGPLLNALVVTLIFFLFHYFLQSIKAHFPIPEAVIIASVFWVLAARAETPILLYRMLIISSIHAFAGLFLKKKESAGLRKWEIAVIGVVIIGTALFVSLGKDIRSTETTAEVQHAAWKGEWKKVLEIVTPESSEKEPKLMPYAFLAMGYTGELGERLFSYPIRGVEDFDMEEVHTVEGCYFNSILNNCMGNYNEAIHHIFQYSCHFPLGTTHFSLSQLIRYNHSLGNFTMMRKYAQILSHSPRYFGSARRLLKRIEGAQDSIPPAGHLSHEAHTTTNNTPYDLLQLSLAGINSGIAQERYMCYMLLTGDLKSFVEAFSVYEWYRIPRHYEEALLIAGVDPRVHGISPETEQRFKQLSKVMAQMDVITLDLMTKGTFWNYHLHNQLKGILSQ